MKESFESDLERSVERRRSLEEGKEANVARLEKEIQLPNCC